MHPETIVAVPRRVFHFQEDALKSTIALMREVAVPRRVFHFQEENELNINLILKFSRSTPQGFPFSGRTKKLKNKNKLNLVAVPRRVFHFQEVFSSG